MIKINNTNLNNIKKELKNKQNSLHTYFFGSLKKENDTIKIQSDSSIIEGKVTDNNLLLSIKQ